MPDKEERKLNAKAQVQRVANDSQIWLANWLRKHGTTAPLAKPKPVIIVPPPAPTPPPTPIVWQVGAPGSLWQATDGSQAPGPGFPATRPILDSIFYKVDPAMLALIRAVERLLNPLLSDADFERNLDGLFRDNAGFSNQHGIKSEKNSFAIQGLSACGAMYRAVTGLLHRAVGVLWLQVDALDPLNLPAIPTRVDQIDMARWFIPITTSGNPFPQFGGRCLIPAFGAGGTNWIQWNNFNRADKIGLAPISQFTSPLHPDRPEITADLILV